MIGKDLVAQAEWAVEDKTQIHRHIGPRIRCTLPARGEVRFVTWLVVSGAQSNNPAAQRTARVVAAILIAIAVQIRVALHPTRAWADTSRFGHFNDVVTGVKIIKAVVTSGITGGRFQRGQPRARGKIERDRYIGQTALIRIDVAVVAGTSGARIQPDAIAQAILNRIYDFEQPKINSAIEGGAGRVRHISWVRQPWIVGNFAIALRIWFNARLARTAALADSTTAAARIAQRWGNVYTILTLRQPAKEILTITVAVVSRYQTAQCIIGGAQHPIGASRNLSYAVGRKKLHGDIVKRSICTVA